MIFLVTYLACIIHVTICNKFHEIIGFDQLKWWTHWSSKFNNWVASKLEVREKSGDKFLIREVREILKVCDVKNFHDQKEGRILIYFLRFE